MNQAPNGSRRRPSGSTIIAGILIGIVAVLTIVGGLTALQPETPVTEQADRTVVLYQVTLIISLIVFFLVTAGIIWACFRYKRRGPDIPEQIHGSNVLEATWTIIPIIILVALFVPSFILVRDLKTPPDEDEIFVTVEAVAHQWWWEFIYPNGVRVQQTPPDYNNLTPPALVLPTDKTVVIKVRSTDVIHSFYAINTAYKIHAVPGTINQLHFKIEDEGTYFGQCYQFCGLRHSDMLFVLDARSEQDYETWLSEQRRAQGIKPDNKLVTLREGD